MYPASSTFYRLETYVTPERLGYEPRKGHFAIVSHFDFGVDKHRFVAPLVVRYVTCWNAPVWRKELRSEHSIQLCGEQLVQDDGHSTVQRQYG